MGSTKTRPMVEVALETAGWGWPVLPDHHILPHGGCSCSKGSGCRTAGKHPRLKHWEELATTDTGAIQKWWRRHPLANVGVLTAPRSGIFMVGPDGPAGLEALADLERRHGRLPPTPSTSSPSGGGHRIFAWPCGVHIQNQRNHRGLPIDIRGHNGQFVAPGSRNQQGAYAWLPGLSPEEVEVAQAPAWLLDWCQPEAPTPSAHHGGNGFTRTATGGASVRDRAIAYVRACPPAISGQGGHDRTFATARAVIWGFDITPEEGFDILWHYYNSTCCPPWSEAELRHKCMDAYTRDFNKPRGYLLNAERPGTSYHTGNGQALPPGTTQAGLRQDDEAPRLTDRGNSLRLTRKHGQDLRHVGTWSAWLTWDGKRWQRDETGCVVHLAKQTVADLFRTTQEDLAAIAREMEEVPSE